MTTRPTPRVLALAAAVTSLLLLAPLHQAEAKGGGSVRTTAPATAAYSYGQSPVVRDHRKNPQPYALPRHHHHHGGRR